ncbi:MAG: penicillin-binding protein 2 [Actinomycetota bacterium]
MSAPNRIDARVRVLLSLALALFGILATRLYFMQVLAVDEARAAARQNALRLLPIPAPRGRILDVKGRVLVGNRMSLQITVDRQQLGDDRERVLLELSRVLGTTASDLGERLNDQRYYYYQPVPVASDVPKDVAFWIVEHRDELPGVDVRQIPVRTYPYGELAAHVLGYLGQISAEQLEDPAYAAYRSGDVIGRSGIEAVYEADLRGTDGYVSYRVDSTGRNLGQFGRKAPLPGDDVALTIDADLQATAEESLLLGIEQARRVFDPNTSRTLRANAGAVIVLDANTGSVRAIASYPSYDPSVFTSGLTQTQYEQLFGASTGYPLLNRAIQGQYPPGSTFKPWILLSALRRNLVRTSESYACPPSWNVPDDVRQFRNWTSVDQGMMSLARSLSQSCDTIYYPIGYEYWRIYYPPPSADGIAGNDDDAPKEPLQTDLASVGFGRPTGVDLPGEYGGRIPDALWKRSIHDRYPKDFPFGDWVPGDFVNMSIGQGDTLVTPMQMAQAYAALMRGGRICAPRLLRAVQTADGTPVRTLGSHCNRKLAFSVDDLAYVRDALGSTVRDGTAAAVFRGFPLNDVWVSGKTGTAQVFNRQDFSWFAAMTARGEERYVVVALVEQGGHGSTTAAPIARRIIEALYGLPLTQFATSGATD